MPHGTLTAAMAPHHAAAPTVTAGVGIPAANWVKVTDSPSGITVKLPGEAEAVKVDGSPCRDYSAETADARVGVLFAVCDAQETPKMSDLRTAAKGSIDGFRKASGNAAINSSTRETTFDGHPTLDLRLSTKEGGPDSKIGAFRYIADDTYFIMAQTVADTGNEKSLDSTHKRLIAEIRIPDRDR